MNTQMNLMYAFDDFQNTECVNQRIDQDIVRTAYLIILNTLSYNQILINSLLNSPMLTTYEISVSGFKELLSQPPPANSKKCIIQ